MHHQQWILAAAAVVGFCVAISLQSWFVNSALERVFRAEQRVDTIEQWSKLTRQDMAGVLLSMGMTNGLLGAIVAVLVFR